MKQLLIIPLLILLAATCENKPCPECPECDTVTCDTTIIHDSINWIDQINWINDTIWKDTTVFNYKDSTIYHIVDTVHVNCDTFILPQPVPVPIPCDCPCDTTCPEEPQTDVLWQTDFTGLTIGSSSPYRLQGINDFLSLPGISDWQHNISPPQYTPVEIRTENGNSYLFGEVIADDPSEDGTSRFQNSIRFDQDLEVYHFSYVVYWSPDIRYLETHPNPMDWFSIIELWEDHRDGTDGDVSGQARWNVGFFTDGGGAPLYWDLHMELMQPASVRFDKVWTESNRSFPVPLGEWVNLEFYFERGTPGRIYLKINGTTVFDVQRPTEYVGSLEPLPIWALNTMKLYTSTTRLNYLRNSGRRLYAYYDNFKWLP